MGEQRAIINNLNLLLKFKMSPVTREYNFRVFYLPYWAAIWYIVAVYQKVLITQCIVNLFLIPIFSHLLQHFHHVIGISLRCNLCLKDWLVADHKIYIIIYTRKYYVTISKNSSSGPRLSPGEAGAAGEMLHFCKIQY